jgi:protein O-mannosyl-transferase
MRAGTRRPGRQLFVMSPGESSELCCESRGAVPADGDATAPPAPAWRWSQAALIAALALLAALPYLNTLSNGFVWDDSTQVLTNPYIRNLHHFREIFTTTVWSYRGGAEAATAYYRPLMTLLYLACFQLFGPVASVFHLANVLLNALVVIALFKVTERMFQRRGLAFAAAAMFALHPIHSEAVDWIAAVTDLELAFFYLITFWFFLTLPVNHLGRARKKLLAQLGMTAGYVMALLSKETAVTLPLLATLYEHLYRDDRSETSWSQKLSRYGAMWALAVVYLTFRVHFLTLVKTARFIQSEDVPLSAVGLVGQYVWKFLWPVRLSAFYVFPDNSLWDLFARVPGGLVAIVFLAILFWILWGRARRVSFGVLWFVVTLAPVLNPRWMPANVVSERYLYLPSVGLCWVMAWAAVSLFDWLAGRRAALRWVLAAALTVLALLCVIRIFTRNRDWHDELTFFTRTVAASPNSVQMLIDLGQVYFNRGDLKSAEREWLQARKIAPDYPILLDGLGALYTRQHRYDDATDALQRCIQQSPEDVEAHVNLGQAYAQMGQVQPAEKELRTAVDLAPLNVHARTMLGEYYFARGRYRDAAEQFGRSIDSIPTSKAYLGEGLASLQMGEPEQAERDFKKAAAVDPNDSRPHFVLGYFYGEMGRTNEAIKEYNIGFKIDPDNQDAHTAFQKLKIHDSDGRVR